MLKTLLSIGVMTMAFTSLPALADADHPHVRLETSQGNIELELDAKAAPRTVKNFLSYVDEGYYVGTVFHRVIPDFMIQGGGMDADLDAKAAHDPIALERSGLKNQRGTIAMARTNDPDSATSQFFINLVDNASLDYQGLYQPGYTVFGHVVSGMDVVDGIAATPTGQQGPYGDVPKTPITITGAKRLD